MTARLSQYWTNAANERDLELLAREIQKMQNSSFSFDFQDFGEFLDRVFGGFEDTKMDPLLLKCDRQSPLVKALSADGALFYICVVLQSKGRWLDFPFDRLPPSLKRRRKQEPTRTTKCTAFEYLCFRLALFPTVQEETIVRLQSQYPQAFFDRADDSYRSILQSYLNVLLPHSKLAGRQGMVDVELQQFATFLFDSLYFSWIVDSIETLLRPPISTTPLKFHEPPYKVLSALTVFVSHVVSDKANHPMPPDPLATTSVRNAVELSQLVKMLIPDLFLLLRSACLNFRSGKSRDWSRLPFYLDIWRVLIAPWLIPTASLTSSSSSNSVSSLASAGGLGNILFSQSPFSLSSSSSSSSSSLSGEQRMLKFTEDWNDYVFQMIPFYTAILVEFVDCFRSLDRPFGVGGGDRLSTAATKTWAVFADAYLLQNILEARKVILRSTRRNEGIKLKESQMQNVEECVRMCEAHLLQYGAIFSRFVYLLGVELDNETTSGWKNLVILLRSLRTTAVLESIAAARVRLSLDSSFSSSRDSSRKLILSSLPNGSVAKHLDDVIFFLEGDRFNLDVGANHPPSGANRSQTEVSFAKSPSRSLNGTINRDSKTADELLRGVVKCSIADLKKVHAHVFVPVENVHSHCFSCKRELSDEAWTCKVCREDPDDSTRANLVTLFDNDSQPRSGNPRYFCEDCKEKQISLNLNRSGDVPSPLFRFLFFILRDLSRLLNSALNLPLLVTPESQGPLVRAIKLANRVRGTSDAHVIIPAIDLTKMVDFFAFLLVLVFAYLTYRYLLFAPAP